MMRKVVLSMAPVATALSLAIPPASAQEPPRLGPYFHASLGAQQPRDISGSAYGYHVTGEFESGVALAAGIGYRFSPNFRGEIELGYGHTQLKSLSVAGRSFSASSLGADERIDAYSGFVSGYLDIPVNPTFTPYLGLGVGAIRLESGGEGDSAFAMFGELGLGVTVSETVSIVPSLRYTWTDYAIASGFDKVQFWTAKIGLRIAF